MKRIVLLASAVCLFAACNQKGQITSDAPYSKVFIASTESSRTYASGENVCWNTGDDISVFDKNTANAQYIYAGEAGATRGEFVPGAAVEAQGSLPMVYAAYPYDEEVVIESDGTMNLWFLPQQEYAKDSFGPAANLMVAVSEDNSLAFKNVCGYLNVRIYGDDSSPILGIQVEGNNQEAISGEFFVTPNSSGGFSIEVNPELSMDYVVLYDPDKSVTLSSSSSEAASFWVALPPVTFSEGITVYVASADGREAKITSDNPLEIKRGVCTTTAPAKVTFPEPVTPGDSKEYINENITGYYRVDSESFYSSEGYGPYSELLYISAAPEGAPGNVLIEGELAELQVSFYADYSPEDEAILIHPGTVVYTGPVWNGDPTEYDVLMYIVDDKYRYSRNDIPLFITDKHELVYAYEGTGYWIGFLDSDDYTVDILTSISFTYVTSSGSSGYGQMRAPDYKERVRALAGKPVKALSAAMPSRRSVHKVSPFGRK